MSTLSQFTGGSSPAIGEFAYPPSSAWTTNQTVGSKEYLATGTVKTYSATYATLAQTKSLACANATGATGWQNSFTSSWNYERVGGASRGALVGNNYHHISIGTNGGSILRVSSTLGNTSPTTITGVNVIYDAEVFNGYSLVSHQDAANAYISYSNAATYTAVNIGPNVGGYVFAKSGSQINVLYAGALMGGANDVYTSTNGTSWTARTPSGSYGGNQPRAYYWSQPAGVFVLWTGNPSTLATSANGYDNWTQRTQPTGYPAANTTVSLMNSMRSATSSSATIFLHSTGVIIRNTTVSDFTAIDLRTSFPVFANDTCYLMHDGTRFIIVHASGFTITSTDGLSWSPDFRRFSSTNPEDFASTTIIYGANMSGSDSFLSAGSLANLNFNTSRSARMFVFTGKYGMATPDFVGHPHVQNATGNLATHLRIA